MNASTGGWERALTGHFCTSLQRMGWSGLRNGELLEKMRPERFDVFITGDRNLQFQQNLPAAGVAVIVLRAGSTRLAETLPLMSPLLTLLPKRQAGHGNISSGILTSAIFCVRLL